MKANGPKRKIFDAVDMMTADMPQVETGNGLQDLPVDKIEPFHDHPFHLYEGERLEDMVEERVMKCFPATTGRMRRSLQG